MRGHGGRHAWRVAVRAARPGERGGTVAASGGGDGAVKLWDLGRGPEGGHETSLMLPGGLDGAVDAPTVDAPTVEAPTV